MSGSPRIISDIKSLKDNFHCFKKGDIIKGRIPMISGEEHLLLDLVERGVHLIPSATSQLSSRSKAFQARIFKHWMIPETYTVYNRHQLLEYSNIFHKKRAKKVILKQDRKNAGLGILLYNTIEDIYNQAASDCLAYPFVIQPFLQKSTDLRVIVLDDYTEAYTRFNPGSFRNNLHCGGQAKPFTLTDKILNLCEDIMDRGSFPYGHLDFMLTAENDIYLAEINLRGGMRGAAITTSEYKEKVAAIEEKLVAKHHQ